VIWNPGGSEASARRYWRRSDPTGSCISRVDVRAAQATPTGWSGIDGPGCGQARRGVLVRDTKQHEASPLLRFTLAAWRRFADEVKRSLGY
jgi:hypothetical protein